jgi:hypothetical protein
VGGESRKGGTGGWGFGWGWGLLGMLLLGVFSGSSGSSGSGGSANNYKPYYRAPVDRWNH